VPGECADQDPEDAAGDASEDALAHGLLARCLGNAEGEKQGRATVESAVVPAGWIVSGSVSLHGSEESTGEQPPCQPFEGAASSPCDLISLDVGKAELERAVAAVAAPGRSDPNPVRRGRD
jgi:hypothetical protein